MILNIKLGRASKTKITEIITIILFIVQCWTQASKPGPLKQDTQKENKLFKIKIFFKSLQFFGVAQVNDYFQIYKTLVYIFNDMVQIVSNF